jgi:hypothetical protein
VEWFIIGLSPWSDRSSPRLLIALFHAGMFSFWGTVALGPHILLDCRPETAAVQRRLQWTFAVLMAVTYGYTLTAKAADTLREMASVWFVVATFLTMNVFYIQYFRACGRCTPLVPASAGLEGVPRLPSGDV